jgi:hypothetical protein
LIQIKFKVYESGIHFFVPLLKKDTLNKTDYT